MNLLKAYSETVDTQFKKLEWNVLVAYTTKVVLRIMEPNQEVIAHSKTSFKRPKFACEFRFFEHCVVNFFWEKIETRLPGLK